MSSSTALSLYASTKNKLPILTAIIPILDKMKSQKDVESNIQNSHLRVVEIASGTGEHTAFFKSALPYLIYQPTEPDVTMHESIKAWCREFEDSHTVYPPIALDVNNYDETTTDTLLFPVEFQNQNVDVFICINMIHISPIQSTHSLFKMASNMIKTNGILITYGPYKINGYMVASNEQFDGSLKTRNWEWGIRELNDIQQIAEKNDFTLEEKIEMPSNNLTLIFRKIQRQQQQQKLMPTSSSPDVNLEEGM